MKIIAIGEIMGDTWSQHSTWPMHCHFDIRLANGGIMPSNRRHISERVFTVVTWPQSLPWTWWHWTHGHCLTLGTWDQVWKHPRRCLVFEAVLGDTGNCGHELHPGPGHTVDTGHMVTPGTWSVATWSESDTLDLRPWSQLFKGKLILIILNINIFIKYLTLFITIPSF